jgi:Zn finger protein HypA/HybF involved in hydrogenase expression
MKELSQSRINKPFAVSLKKTDKSPTAQPLEGQADGSVSIDDEDRIIIAQQRICAWCNTVMREGTKPATHGMCPKCLEGHMHSLEEQKSHSESEAPVREIFYKQANPRS